VKDLEAAAGYVTTFGDPAHASDPPATADSVEVARLKAAGAVVVGKTNTPAYGFHAETDNRIFGPTRNPQAPSRTSGGSSGGSAAAIAAGLVPLCTGSDGGGSIRIPSSVCGISGFKVTHGVVPNGDAGAPTWGLYSTRGPMARTFAEIAVALDAVVGFSARDLISFELAGSFADAAARPSLDGVRVVVSTTLGYSNPDPRVVTQLERAVQRLEAHGARVVDTDEQVFDTQPVRAWMMRAAAGSWRTATKDPMPWSERFLEAAQLTAQWGEHITAAQILDGEEGAQHANLRLAAIWDRADVLITPATPAVAPRVGEASPYGPAWASDFTLPFNLVRAPAAVVRCGTVDDDGDRLPIAMQVVAPRTRDLQLMSIVSAAESILT
jgi:Asp-tRNA(Asn)/Glu-tRNA(Gln) amidotransferase A subunit family amidase